MLDAHIINAIRDAEHRRERAHVVLELDPPRPDAPDHDEAEPEDRGPVIIPLRDDDAAEEDDAA